MILPPRLLRRWPRLTVRQGCRRLIGIPLLLVGIRRCLSLILSFRLLRCWPRLTVRQGCRRLIWIPIRLVCIRRCLSLILPFRLLRRRPWLTIRQGCRRLVWLEVRPVRLVWPSRRLHGLLRRRPRLSARIYRCWLARVSLLLSGVRRNWPSRYRLSRNLLPRSWLSTLVCVCRLTGILILPTLSRRHRLSCRISRVRRRGNDRPAGNRLGSLSRPDRRCNRGGPRPGNNLLALLVDQSRAL